AWSTNFMTEWHARYAGPGVMIYWHVERKSVCIYSQLKSCSASEVAAMIEGLMRHSTNVEIDRNYTDTPWRLCRCVRVRAPARLPAVAAPQEHRLGAPVPPRPGERDDVAGA
ncbi:MAG: Tn3 family transposase, partial [Solirubrobacteraceae bacterium]